MHICDITFEPNDEGCVVTTPFQVEQVARLLEVRIDELLSCLTDEIMMTRGEYIVVILRTQLVGCYTEVVCLYSGTCI